VPMGKNLIKKIKLKNYINNKKLKLKKVKIKKKLQK
jgi:hypothetical protein